MADPIAIGGDLYVIENFFVRNDIFVVVSLACVNGYLHIIVDVEFVSSVDSLVGDVDEDLLMKNYV